MPTIHNLDCLVASFVSITTSKAIMLHFEGVYNHWTGLLDYWTPQTAKHNPFSAEQKLNVLILSVMVSFLEFPEVKAHIHIISRMSIHNKLLPYAGIHVRGMLLLLSMLQQSLLSTKARD